MQTNPSIVLIIENHPIMREALCTAIASESDLVVVSPAASGPEALQMLAVLSPDVILFALGNNGKENGLETLKSLRKTMPVIPILALTTNEVTGQDQAALEAGANRVLTKAAPRAELIQALYEVWGQALKDHSEIRSKKRYR
jgi:DNA-binding NarL/FixJ family response regulator